MSMMQDFYVFLADMFTGGEGPMDPKEIKDKMEDEGFGDVTAHDVKEAVNLMYEEGDVFAANQSSVLEAYTGGNMVDQSFNGSGIGVANTAANASSGPATNTAGSGGAPAAQAPPAAATPPPPPPMDPAEGYTELDAAVQQIVYVSNITNNNVTNNTTTIDDRDVFEDNDTIVDASVDQNIFANGDVNQNFDTTTVAEGGIAVDGNVNDANLVTGDNDGVIADDITDSNVVAGDNFGVSGDGSAQGEGNAVGEGAFIGDGNATGEGSTAGDGNTTTFVNGSNDGVLANGTGGDVNAIEDSTVGAAGFGEGAVSNNVDNSDNSDNSTTTTTTTTNTTTTTDNSDNSTTNINDHSTDIDANVALGGSTIEDNDAEISSSVVTDSDQIVGNEPAAAAADAGDPGADLLEA